MTTEAERLDESKVTNKEDLITAEDARALILYDPETGSMVRNTGGQSFKKGSKAGFVDVHGYIRVGLNKIVYRAHRVAWLIYYGEWPRGQVDHINGNKQDNRISNLRIATPSVNVQNIGGRSDNTTGFPGVRVNGSGYSSSIRVDKKRIHLGTYKTPEEAFAAYVNAKEKHHPGASNCLISRMEQRRSDPQKTIDTCNSLLRQALEALENSVDYAEGELTERTRMWSNLPSRAKHLTGLKELADAHVAAITAIKQHLGEV